MERNINIGANGKGEFFLIIRCADGSVCQEGPYTTFGDAKQAEYNLETGAWANANDGYAYYQYER